MVKRRTYGTTDTILKVLSPIASVAVVINSNPTPPAPEPPRSENRTENENDRIIMKAGTIIGNSGSGIRTPNNNEFAEGLLLHDVDITDGDTPATMLVQGIVDLDKIPEVPTEEALSSADMTLLVFK